MFITGTGLVCPVGLNAVSACAAKRAGISAFADLPHHNNVGEAIVGAFVPDLDWRLSRASRLLQLLTKGLTDLIGNQQDARRHRYHYWYVLRSQNGPEGVRT